MEDNRTYRSSLTFGKLMIGEFSPLGGTKVIGSNVKRALLEQVADHPGSVLSLYIDVNPASRDNTPKAFVLRAAQAMRRLELDKRYIQQVSDKLTQDFAISKGRSLVVFAGEDIDKLFNAYYLQSELPLLDLSDGALANWGKPFIAPLLFALDQRERYGVIYVSTERVRVFEAFLGQIDELTDFVRVVDTESWQPYREARRSPGIGAGVAARGGADVDRYEDRLGEATARLYRSLLPDVEKALKESETDRVILIGQPAAVSSFQGLMNAATQKRVVGTLPPPANPDGPAREWLPLVKGLIDKAELEHEMKLLDKIRESGVWGLQETLTMMQEHRIHTLVVPWTVKKHVYRSAGGRISASEEEAKVLFPEEEVTEVRLLEVLPDLVQQTNTTLEFVEGEAETRLNDDFGGMAGVRRW